MKNSKLPWTWGINDDYQLMIYDADGNQVAQVISEDCEADAELICRGANRHESDICEETRKLAPFRIYEDNKIVCVYDRFGLLVYAFRKEDHCPNAHFEPRWEAEKAFVYDAVNLINEKAEDGNEQTKE